MNGEPLPYIWDREARRVTWWGALGLALSLYGVIVLLEWIYARLTHPLRAQAPPVSVVLRVTNRENHIERAVRDLARLWGERDWEDSAIELVIADGGSSDQTPAIVERLSRRYGFLTVLEPALDADAVIAECRHPVIIWVDFSSATPWEEVMGTVYRLLDVQMVKTGNGVS